MLSGLQIKHGMPI
jgi:hypothetical protein